MAAITSTSAFFLYQPTVALVNQPKVTPPRVDPVPFLLARGNCRGFIERSNYKGCPVIRGSQFTLLVLHNAKGVEGGEFSTNSPSMKEILSNALDFRSALATLAICPQTSNSRTVTALGVNYDAIQIFRLLPLVTIQGGRERDKSTANIWNSFVYVFDLGSL